MRVCVCVLQCELLIKAPEKTFVCVCVCVCVELGCFGGPTFVCEEGFALLGKRERETE